MRVYVVCMHVCMCTCVCMYVFAACLCLFFVCALSTAQNISFSVLRYARCDSNQHVVSGRHLMRLSVEGQLVLDSADTYL
jgi:hypothetical protein